jgi:hypothetical protein
MKGKEEGGGGQSKEMPASLIGFKQTQTWAKHWALPICRMGVPREDSHRQYKRYDSQEQWRGTGICIKICCHQKKKGIPESNQKRNGLASTSVASKKN